MLIITISLMDILQHPAQSALSWQCCLLLRKATETTGRQPELTCRTSNPTGFIPQDLHTPCPCQQPASTSG